MYIYIYACMYIGYATEAAQLYVCSRMLMYTHFCSLLLTYIYRIRCGGGAAVP